MPKVHAIHVVPALPDSLKQLRDIAFNLRWAWNHDAIDLFRRLDRDLWEESGHNPVLMLGTVAQEKLQAAAQDDTFLTHLDRVHRSNEIYREGANTWFRRQESAPEGTRIAYFSMEFGLTEALPIYSGGLGVLAGDHLKSSSDLGLPLTGIGLLYQQGYFRQSLNGDGWQQERYPENDFYHLPLQSVSMADGHPLRVCVEFPGRSVYAQVWKVQVGRVPLYLLDTNIPQNNPDDQNITDQLYGGDMEMRLKQELILGIGGLRALTALGIKPTICHMNEGHSAFLALERIRLVMQEYGVSFREAQEVCAAGNLFTTHTPVPAGFDIFPRDMMERYFGAFAHELGLDFETFLGQGRIYPQEKDEKFNMAVLALRNSHQCNGVSRLHGEVTRGMVAAKFAGYPISEVPVGHVTNGVHTRSFLSREMADVLDRYLGSRWSQEVSEASVWDKIEGIPDEELWRVRQQRREALVQFARTRLRKQGEHRGASDYELRKVNEILNPDALTIGFARRFATYKRATLLLSDVERLKRLLNDSERPVQIVMAGKSHPKDDGGKELIRHIAQFCRTPEVRNRFVFIEDYDMNVARYLVQGVDVWLNTPRRPMEASGTSGMKVLANGGLNCSIPDGWWAEGREFDPLVGWTIGRGEEYADPGYQDHIESNALYELLEKEIVPLFYDRAAGGVPRGWVARMRRSMRLLTPVYNTHRMVSEYAGKFYLPATARYKHLHADRLSRAKALVAWKERLETHWGDVRVESVEAGMPEDETALTVGTAVPVNALVRLGSLTPADVRVEAYHGPLDINHQVTNGHPIPLTWRSESDGFHRYEGAVKAATSGIQGFSVRILPHHADAALPNELALIAWE